MKRLGLDLGSSSTAWTLREGEKIEKWGVITFQAGMRKGQGGGYSSPTKDRREARSKRRLIQAKKYRKWALLKILLNEYVPLEKVEFEGWSKYQKGKVRKFPENKSFLKWLACDFTYEGGIKYENPYQLRVKALDNKLSKHEFGRALYHLVQRRGYKNIGEDDTEEFDVELAKKDSETKTQLERRDKDGFKTALQNHGTIAQALQKEFLDKGLKARNQYPLRREYRDELDQICKGQGYDISRNEKGEYVNEFMQGLWKAIIWQRPLKSQKVNVGKCTLEPSRLRCPVSHPVFEIFRAWSFINTIKYYNENDEKISIPQEYRNLLFEEKFLTKGKNFKFEEIRKFLDKQFGSKKRYNYPTNKKGEYDSSVSGMPICKGLIGVLGEEIIKESIATIENYNIGNAPKTIHGYSIYDLWHILLDFDESPLKDFALERLHIENKKDTKGREYNPFAKLKDDILMGYADLSLKAMCKIIPFLKGGYLYNEAVVLAKIPESLGEQWEQEKEKIRECVRKSNEAYSWHKTIVGITNNLIDIYKGDVEEWREQGRPVKAWKEFNYTINDDDVNDIEKACQNYFGQKSWKNKAHKGSILDGVKELYQEFFKDNKRVYREVPLLADIFNQQLKENKIEIKGNLYHHSNRENLYLKKMKGNKTGVVKLPVDKNTGLELLPNPQIDSIKNPMFNKAMSILRRLLNELIKNGTIDEDTEIVVEVARELNDNNKRIAIERYQNERKNNREKYREFLKEFKDKGKNSLNIDESIGTFELWTEQIFEETENEEKEKVANKNNNDILKEKDAIKRYELWMEQKGQCMYTGRMISITQLFSNEIDIAHTIPRSLLPDNTMANITVCYARYNRDYQETRTPFYCDNYFEDKHVGTAIRPRLGKWMELRDSWKKRYEKNLKPHSSEDEVIKNRRIQEKHYCKMHYDYWHDKVERFTAEEVRDKWARRQLVDTQMVSKYAREYLKTYFKKVAVQKGSTTADFRKIYGFQEEDEIKSRNRHTHHAIDAAVLTLIPINSSHRDRILKKMYEMHENEKKQYTTIPYAGFNSQKLIREIDNTTLIVNYQKNVILKQTFKNVRKRGKLQYLKDEKGDFVLDGNNKILLKSKGDTVRSALFKDTFVAKIRDVKRNTNGQPLRENGDWEYKKGKDEFTYHVRKPIKDAQSKVEDIIDPVIKELVRRQKNNVEVKDHQGNIIRHVRMKSRVGREVKERINYRSKYDHKNKYYAASDSIPCAILLQNSNDGKIEREIIPVASFEMVKLYRKLGEFNAEQYIKEYHPSLISYSDKKLLMVGQKVIVLNNDEEYEKRNNIDFQTNRLYVITQFSDIDNTIMLKYHLEAQADDNIDDFIKSEKDKLLRRYEIKYEVPEVIEDNTIENIKERKEKYKKERYSFKSFKDYRLKRLIELVGIDKVREIKNELGMFKTYSSSIGVEGKTPLLKMTKANWNFLYEGDDFEISLLGKIRFNNDLK